MTGHDYRWDTLARCHICAICGTAKHKACWWFAGKKYNHEPVCGGEKLANNPVATPAGLEHLD